MIETYSKGWEKRGQIRGGKNRREYSDVSWVIRRHKNYRDHSDVRKKIFNKKIKGKIKKANVL